MAVARRRVLSMGVAAVAAPFVPGGLRAESYPVRPVRMLVGFPPGGGADLLTRIICERLQARLGQAFIVENRPGAGTNLATEAVVRAPADGYTLLATSTSNLLNGALYEDLKYDFIRDIAPVASVSTQPLALVVGADFPARSVAQFIAYAKAHPGRVNIGNSGNGTIAHLAAEFLAQATGIDTVTVPYRGFAPMLTDLLGARVDAAIENLPASIEHIRSGRLQALAVTTATRSEALPNVPTVAELVPGYEAYAIAGIAAPRGTPADIVDRLNTEINAGLVDATLKARLADLGATAVVGTPADFTKLIARETEKWGRVIRVSGVKMATR